MSICLLFPLICQRNKSRTNVGFVFFFVFFQLGKVGFQEETSVSCELEAEDTCFFDKLVGRLVHSVN